MSKYSEELLLASADSHAKPKKSCEVYMIGEHPVPLLADLQSPMDMSLLSACLVLAELDHL